MKTKSALPFVFLLALAGSPAFAQDFQQGPGNPGQAVDLTAKVIGIQAEQERTYTLLEADSGRKGWEGLGGGGRFFWCAKDAPHAIGTNVEVNGIQVDTRRTRWGRRWQVVPVYATKGTCSPE